MAVIGCFHTDQFKILENFRRFIFLPDFYFLNWSSEQNRVGAEIIKHRKRDTWFRTEAIEMQRTTRQGANLSIM